MSEGEGGGERRRRETEETEATEETEETEESEETGGQNSVFMKIPLAKRVRTPGYSLCYTLGEFLLFWRHSCTAEVVSVFRFSVFFLFFFVFVAPTSTGYTRSDQRAGSSTFVLPIVSARQVVLQFSVFFSNDLWNL